MAKEDELLNAYREEIEAFTEHRLRPYLQRIKTYSAGSAPKKEFNDPIWGTLVLHGHEVVVLDSPILQRLRRIRQLGVAHYVYMAAVHTRLEHSLGVCHQVHRLVESINEHASSPDHPIIDSRLSSTLRMAGLCHDIGHGMMSHVSENALRNDRDCEELLLSFRRNVRPDSKSKLSEIAAYYILKSPSFRELLEHAHRLGGQHFDTDMPYRIAKMIIGSTVANEFPLLHELISGPFDADKLDYMPRDATMCGVPVVTDVTRLIQKVRAVQVTQDRLPEELQRVVEEGEITYTVVGIARSGAGTLDELALSRSLMFDKIYRHHKVRAIETMVTAIVDILKSLRFTKPWTLPLELYDDEILTLNSSDLARQAVRELTTKDQVRLHVVTDIASRLRERRLFVRSFAFSQKMPLDPYRGDNTQRNGVERLIRETSDPVKRGDIVKRLIEIVERIVGLLGRSEDLRDIPGQDLTPYVWIDPPAYSIIDTQPDTSRAFLIDQGNLIRAEQASAATRGWADAYINTHDIGYIFCPKVFSDVVYLASETMVRLDFNVRTPHSMMVYAKQDDKRLDGMRRDLEAAGFYDEMPWDLRPMPKILTRGDSTRRVQGIVDRLAGYHGPVDIGRETGKVDDGYLNRERVKDWIRQFPGEMAEPALLCLENLKLIDRALINSALLRFLELHPSFKNSAIVPLGEPKDGAAVLTYYVGDTASEEGCQILPLEQALIREPSIIFVDDIVGTGSSSISIMETLLGESSTQNLHEVRVHTLSKRAQDLLRERDLAFVYAAGLTKGQETLAARSKELGLSATIYVHEPQAQLPSVRDVLNGKIPSEQIDQFVEKCSMIGRELLNDGNPQHDESWRAARKTGYGNLALLVVSAYNTPSVTLTALWKEGRALGAPWAPLCPRRKKL